MLLAGVAGGLAVFCTHNLFDNLFDKYAFTSVRRDRGDAGLATYPEMNVNDPALQRNYGHFILTPMTVGMKFNYQFEI